MGFYPDFNLFLYGFYLARIDSGCRGLRLRAWADRVVRHPSLLVWVYGFDSRSVHKSLDSEEKVAILKSLARMGENNPYIAKIRFGGFLFWPKETPVRAF